MENKKPKFFLVLKIVAICMLVVGVTLIVLGTTKYKIDDYMLNPALFAPGIVLTVLSLPCFIISFLPEIQRLGVKTIKYMQNANKEDLKDISTQSVDIRSEAIKNTAKSIKDGIKDTMYCKECGAVIDADSKYCKECGKKIID